MLLTITAGRLNRPPFFVPKWGLLLSLLYSTLTSSGFIVLMNA